MLLGMQLSAYLLRDEDGKVYDNMRFNSERLLPIDAPVVRYIAHVNKLPASVWSRRESDATPT